MFDRVLFLHEGKSMYFGELGPECRTLIDYFENNGARKCEVDENPAEWLLDIAENSNTSWVEVWRQSDERQRVKQELEIMKLSLSNVTKTGNDISSSQFATLFGYQLYAVTKRNFQNHWRTPASLYSKVLLTLGAVSRPLLITCQTSKLIHVGPCERFLVLSLRQQPPGCAESALLYISSLDTSQQHCADHHAPISHQPRPI